MSHASDDDYADGLVFTDAGFDFFLEKLDYETQEFILDSEEVAGMPYFVRRTFHEAKTEAVILGMFGFDYVTVFAPVEVGDDETWHTGQRN